MPAPYPVLSSASFASQKRLTGKIYRDGGPLGQAISDIYKDVDAGFVQHEADLASTANGKGASLIGIEDAAAAITATTVEGALAEIATKVNAGSVEETDYIAHVGLLGGAATGSWTLTKQAAGMRLRRTAGVGAADELWIPVVLPNRAAASRGIKPTGLEVNYELDTEDADEVRFEVWKETMGADNAARTMAVLYGEDDLDYDSEHNTAGKRGDSTTAPELHRAVITDAGTPAYLGTDENLWVRIFCNDSTGGGAVLDVTSIKIRYAATYVDVA